MGTLREWLNVGYVNIGGKIMSEERDDVIRQEKQRYRDAYGEHWRIKWDMDQNKKKLEWERERAK